MKDSDLPTLSRLKLAVLPPTNKGINSGFNEGTGITSSAGIHYNVV